MVKPNQDSFHHQRMTDNERLKTAWPMISESIGTDGGTTAIRPSVTQISSCVKISYKALSRAPWETAYLRKFCLIAPRKPTSLHVIIFRQELPPSLYFWMFLCAWCRDASFFTRAFSIVPPGKTVPLRMYYSWHVFRDADVDQKSVNALNHSFLSWEILCPVKRSMNSHSVRITR